MDWKESLAAFRHAADLPSGEDRVEVEASSAATPKKLPKLNIFYEKKGRAGKPATIITGLEQMEDKEVADVARKLKQKMGCGGSSRGGEILLQGDRREQASALLREMGFKI